MLDAINFNIEKVGNSGEICKYQLRIYTFLSTSTLVNIIWTNKIGHLKGLCCLDDVMHHVPRTGLFDF